MSIEHLLQRNREWVAARLEQDPDFFRRQAAQHRPRGLLIGCSDARVPTEIVTGVEVGELFVHRNIANQVQATDQNLVAVVQYAVEVLGIRDIIVCGHEQCGGVKAALSDPAPSHVEGWLANIRQVARLYQHELARDEDHEHMCQHMVELNVREQVHNLSRLPVIAAWRAQGRPLNLHGWLYGLSDGLLRDLHINASDFEVPVHHTASAPRQARRAS